MLVCVGTQCVPSVATRVVAKIYRPIFIVVRTVCLNIEYGIEAYGLHESVCLFEQEKCMESVSDKFELIKFSSLSVDCERSSSIIY